MKRIGTILLVTAMVFVMTACGKNAANENDTPVEILTKVWETYEEDEKFAVNGGNPENVIEDEPAAFAVEDGENLDSVLGYPQHSTALLDDAASLVYTEDANAFTAGAYHVSNKGDVEMLASDLQDNIENRQWSQESPESLLIVKIGENTLVSAFGEEEMVATFRGKLLAVYENAEVAYYEAQLR